MNPERRGGATVFIAYSHKDREWLNRLHVHLAPVARDYDVDIWDDTRIRSGSRWREEIGQAIQCAKAVVLLVSADFLASEFITTEELPQLLRAAQTGGAHILPVILSHCGFLRHPILSQFQTANSPSEPIKSMRRDRQDAVFDKLATEIEEILKATSPANQPGNSRTGTAAVTRTDGTPPSRRQPAEAILPDPEQSERQPSVVKDSAEDQKRSAKGLRAKVISRWPYAVGFLLLILSVCGIAWWGTNHFSVFRTGEAATTASVGVNQVKVTIRKGGTARAFDDSLFINLQETEFDEDSGKYKVIALLSSPNNPPLVIKDKYTSGLITYRYSQTGKFKIWVLSSSADQAEFLLELSEN